jgi:hypothetical protein
MKRLVNLLICVVLAVALTPCFAMALDSSEGEPPSLKSISFENATISEEFSPFVFEYGLILEDTAVTPTLDNYEINGDADIFVTYNLDEASHQTGISVTLEFSSGTVKYTFNYLNAQQYAVSSNNSLSQVTCYLGEVYPAINDKDTQYKLYIPSDMTVIQLSAATQDVSAHCELPGEITLKSDQEPTLTITVTASDTSTKIYSFKVKRLDKTSQEVAEEMAQEDFVSLVHGVFFYQQPIFIVTVCVLAFLIIILAILIPIAKRITVKVEDNDEEEFFDLI